ncbi:unnamed protein product [Euphydryas editha]|uniref:F-box domain-containing protein n=1 Tax=Euphydryas editha TaxID=104508 RepID=A0AAU9V8N3_EUPED|nr:unnamed protein product [Euphydryas editha]
MSKNNANKIFSYWATCPADILLVIFRKLDTKSLLNTMFVNKYWQNIVEYYCQHFNLWDKMIDETINNKGLTFRDKSILSSRDIILTAQQWYNVINATVCLHHKYTFEVVRNICVHKDNLIVVTNNNVKYFNIENSKLLKILNTTCLKYDETSSLIVELSLSKGGVIGYNVLTVVNKLHKKEKCDCTQVKKIILFDITLFRVHLDCCYVIDIKNVLWRYKANKCEWDVKVMAKYYGNQNSICGIHIHQEDVYVLLKRGDVLRVDIECKKFEKVFQLNIPMHYLDTKPYIFHTYSVLCAVSPEKQLQMHVQKGEEQTVVACPGLACVTEHGHILLLGYEDGKIEIFITNNLLRNLWTPELRFYLQCYTKTSTNQIIAMDVYEGSNCHHLFVATDCNIYEFLICDK